MRLPAKVLNSRLSGRLGAPDSREAFLPKKTGTTAPLKFHRAPPWPPSSLSSQRLLALRAKAKTRAVGGEPSFPNERVNKDGHPPDHRRAVSRRVRNRQGRHGHGLPRLAPRLGAPRRN